MDNEWLAMSDTGWFGTAADWMFVDEMCQKAQNVLEQEATEMGKVRLQLASDIDEARSYGND
ncbi:hypothetical protein QE320_gp105 [Pseudomonas phage EM]|uniref:Uncharacterized protein n=1 Tax=Pseudomonas phage EM TaxID=2936914 RepID=A0AAE9HG86_9CAUD|nr:hypothetical protein QE320_gp105 [Pseudomonas phage EM]UPW35949.1 hypothetical protein EM_164 [Pseudomonas phage EM]